MERLKQSVEQGLVAGLEEQFRNVDIHNDVVFDHAAKDVFLILGHAVELRPAQLACYPLYAVMEERRRSKSIPIIESANSWKPREWEWEITTLLRDFVEGKDFQAAGGLSPLRPATAIPDSRAAHIWNKGYGCFP